MWRIFFVMCLGWWLGVVCPAVRAGTEVASVEGRFAVSVASARDHYYLLLRGGDPARCEQAVDMGIGTGGEIILRDAMHHAERAFFKVRAVPLSAPLDTDADGVDDVKEYSERPERNPFNPARGIPFAQGRIFLPDRAAFDAISHRDTFPGAALVREVKFFITDADTERPALYFLNVKNLPFHYLFAQRALGYAGSLEAFNRETYFSNATRKSIAGSLVVHETWQAPGGGPVGVMTLEFWPSDPVGQEFVQKAFDLVALSTVGVGLPMRYHAASETQRAAFRRDAGAFAAARKDRINVISTEQLLGQAAYSLLNPGVGYGRLVLGDGATLTPRDIPIFRSLPNEITRTAGIITAVPQTPLSHINLKAKQNDTPNVYLRDATMDARLVGLLGKLVRFAPGADGLEIREATREEVETAFESLRPAMGQTPRADLRETVVLPLSRLSFFSARAYGAKTANVAELRRLLPDAMVPNGHGVPFYFYDEFMKANGLYDIAERMMAGQEFREDVVVREKALKAFRRLIRNSVAPPWMVEVLAGVQAQFPAGTNIRCRSSTNNEDLEGFSGAGLYDSYTHRPDEGALLETVKQVWASVWTVRAWDERDFYRVPHHKTYMGVLLTQDYDDERSNGVGVTRNIIDPNWTGYYVNAQKGESLVTNPEENAVPEEFLIAQLLGQERYEVQYVTFSNLLPEGETVLSRAQALELADRMGAIQAWFRSLYKGGARFAMEIEWKYTQGGQLVIKQARPYVE